MINQIYSTPLSSLILVLLCALLTEYSIWIRTHFITCHKAHFCIIFELIQVAYLGGKRKENCAMEVDTSVDLVWNIDFLLLYHLVLKICSICCIEQIDEILNDFCDQIATTIQFSIPWTL